MKKTGYEKLAAKLAKKHLFHITETYRLTDTFWGNYKPNLNENDNYSKNEFIRWTGLSVISILIEFVLGIRINSKEEKLTWYINNIEAHGVDNIPYIDDVISIFCEARKDKSVELKVTVNSKEKIERTF